MTVILFACDGHFLTELLHHNVLHRIGTVISELCAVILILQFAFTDTFMDRSSLLYGFTIFSSLQHSYMFTFSSTTSFIFMDSMVDILTKKVYISIVFSMTYARFFCSLYARTR